MNEFHPNETVNDEVAMDGKADMIVQKRAAIKLSEGPRIMVCMPVGGKPVTTVLECPQCKEDPSKSQHEFQVNTGFRPEGLIPLQFMIAQMNWLSPLNVTMAYSFKTRMRSAAARQILTMEALRIPTVKYLFFVDDDTLIPPMGLYQLYNLMERNPEWGAVSGVYTTRQNPPEPLIYTEHGAGAAWDFEMGPGAAPTQIMGAGAGCLLVRADAIRAWMEANPETPIWCDATEFPASNGGKVTWGHDVRFIRNLTEAGWPCYVDGSLLCSHLDIASGKQFGVPADAPGFKKRARNSEKYWDTVYTKEGMDTWRQYPEMFQHVMRALKGSVPYGDNEGLSLHGVFRDRMIVEVGAGSGVLASKVVGQYPVIYVATDHSDVAVQQCDARGLNAVRMDAGNPDKDLLWQATDIVATEVLEHLTDQDLHNFLDVVGSVSSIERMVVTVPDACMPPEEVHEHERMFTQESMRQLLETYGWKDIRICGKEDVDGVHMVVLASRK